MGEWRYEYTHFWPRSSTDVSGQLHAPGVLLPGIVPPGTPDGPQRWSKHWRRERSLALVGNSTPAFQPVLRRYTDCAGTCWVLSPFSFHSSFEKGGEVKPRFWEHWRGSGSICCHMSHGINVLISSTLIAIYVSTRKLFRTLANRVNGGGGHQDLAIIRISVAKRSPKRKKKLRTQINVKM
jgi:hypothetical protein